MDARADAGVGAPVLSHQQIADKIMHGHRRDKGGMRLQRMKGAVT